MGMIPNSPPPLTPAVRIRRKMPTKIEVVEFAEHWVAAWNSHDLKKIMTHYEDDVELISPAAAQILKDPRGRVSRVVATTADDVRISTC
jgi:hypothetical protein